MMKVVPFLLFSTAEALIPHFLKSSSGQSRNIIKATTLIAPVEIPSLVIETPANDDTTEYYQFVLPNGIPATIVRDLTSEKSSCSLAVGAGAQDDPDNRQGLAHFTEHAVFLGSKKFPEERAYKEFLSKNGGSSNAGTGMESTTYKFEVNSNSFSHSLDLFSQFFKDPLFTEDAIAREVMAVDAEDSKNRIIDGRRILQVTKNLMLQNHPYAKFSTGNVNTLASGDAEKNKFDVTKAMRKFHVEHYRPENMALSLVGPQTMEELKALALEMFSDIQYRGEVAEELSTVHELHSDVSDLADKSPVFPFSEGNLIVKVRPIKDIRDISILWSVPPTRDLYRSNPCRLIGFLLGHKGPGSVFALLQDKGWAMSNSAGTGSSYSDFSLFEASVGLTEEGLKNWEEVVSIIYSQIQNISEMKDSELQRVWSEIKASGSINFRYREKATAYELAPFIAGNMLTYPMNHIISAGYLLDEIDVSQVREYISKLTPTTAVTLIRSRTFDWLPDDTPNDATEPDRNTLSGVGANRKEPWYGVSYHTDAPSADMHKKWMATRSGEIEGPPLSLPGPNEYICYELADAPIKESTEHIMSVGLTGEVEEDSHVEKGEGLEKGMRLLRSAKPTPVTRGDSTNTFWYSKDQVFNQPRTVFQCLLHTTNCADGHPENSLMGSIYTQIMTRNLYNAALGGLGYDVGVGARGVSLTVLGYSPKLPTLAAKVFREFGDPSFWQTVDPSLVELCKERMLRSMRSWSKERPDTQADGLLSYMMQENVWLPQDRLLAAETITAESFIKRAQSSLMKRKVTSYVHGNMNQEDALSLNDQCIDALAVNDGESVREDLLVNEEGDIPARARLLTGHTVVALADPNPDDPNSALLTHIQMGVTTSKNAAIMAVLRSIMGEPLFAELRTKKQVGYIVSLSSSGYGRSPGTIRGLTVRLLSNRFSPLTMQVLLGEFFESQKEVFATLTQADLSNRTAAICQTLMDPPTSYTEESGGFWGSIISGMPFDWTEQVIEELRTLQTGDVQIAANEWLFNEKRKSASIMLFGNSHIEELNKVNSGDMESVKGFFPALKDSVICGSFEELTKQRDALEYTSL